MAKSQDRGKKEAKKPKKNKKKHKGGAGVLAFGRAPARRRIYDSFRVGSTTQ
jgi:hypothetical protein